MGISLKPSDAVSGGLVDDVDAVVTKAAFVEWDYAGKIPVAVPALWIHFQVEGEEHDQYYSAGDMKHLKPSADGEMLEAGGSETGLNKSSNCYQFVESLVNAGFPEDKLNDKITVIVGLQCHLRRKAQMKRAGIVRTPVSGEAAREQTILLVEKINALPWETPAKGKGKVGAKAGPAPKAAAADPGLEKVAQEFVVAKIAEAGGTIKANALPTAAFRGLTADPNRNAIVTLIAKPEFLAADGQPWTYDQATGNLTLE